MSLSVTHGIDTKLNSIKSAEGRIRHEVPFLPPLPPPFSLNLPKSTYNLEDILNIEADSLAMSRPPICCSPFHVINRVVDEWGRLGTQIVWTNTIETLDKRLDKCVDSGV